MNIIDQKGEESGVWWEKQTKSKKKKIMEDSHEWQFLNKKMSI
jgi:hypothetical protein